ncbi:hypothetical protein [Streptomyces albus]|nr:hypothetical protein [Streptomyces albus]
MRGPRGGPAAQHELDEQQRRAAQRQRPRPGPGDGHRQQHGGDGDGRYEDRTGAQLRTQRRPLRARLPAGGPHDGRGGGEEGVRVAGQQREGQQAHQEDRSRLGCPSQRALGQEGSAAQGGAAHAERETGGGLRRRGLAQRHVRHQPDERADDGHRDGLPDTVAARWLLHRGEQRVAERSRPRQQSRGASAAVRVGQPHPHQLPDGDDQPETHRDTRLHQPVLQGVAQRGHHRESRRQVRGGDTARQAPPVRRRLPGARSACRYVPLLLPSHGAVRPGGGRPPGAAAHTATPSPVRAPAHCSRGTGT